jgi:putative spermidine/putrescine transport system substrate-binding protein
MRHLSGIVTLLTTSTAALMTTLAVAEPAKTLRILTAGGEWTDAVQECVDKPFEKKYGIKIELDTPAGYAKLAGLAQSGNVNVALMDLETTELERANASGLLDPIDWDKVKPFDMFPDAKKPYGFASTYFSTIMAWRPDAKAPKDWKDFFDTTNFPGKRALPDYPGYVLTFAALADGVTPDKMFPLDLDRAFKTLNRVKGDVIWWTAGGQAAQLMQDNEAQYAIGWSGRIVTKTDISHSFNQGMLDTSWWGAPKGADPAMQEAAWLYLHEYSDPERQACVAKHISYTGPSPKLDPLLPQDKLDQFPNYKANRDVQFVTNGKWWYDNAAEVEKRWQEFKLAQ